MCSGSRGSSVRVYWEPISESKKLGRDVAWGSVLPSSMWTTSTPVRLEEARLLWDTRDTCCPERSCGSLWIGSGHPRGVWTCMNGGWTEQTYQGASVSSISPGGRVTYIWRCRPCLSWERWFPLSWQCLWEHGRTKLILCEVSRQISTVTVVYREYSGHRNCQIEATVWIFVNYSLTGSRIVVSMSRVHPEYTLYYTSRTSPSSLYGVNTATQSRLL